MDAIQLIIDSIAEAKLIANVYLMNPSASEKSVDWFDFVHKVAIVIIAVFNFLFSVYIYKANRRALKEKEIKANRQNLLNTLILNHKLDKFYEIFQTIHSECKMLLNTTMGEDERKSLVNDSLEDLFIRLNLEFIVTLRAVDNTLNQNILDIADELQGKLSENIFDKGIDPHFKEKYDELIQGPISDAEIQIIQKLYEFA